MTSTRENNFSIMKLIAALMVLAGHMGILIGGQPPFFLGDGIHSIGVKILFLIGGYLICKSWMSDSNILSYTIKRFFRIMPPFIVCVLITTFIIGPIVTTLPIKEYFSSPGILYYLRNLILYITYPLPGVFNDLPYPNAVNGSLWTMSVEAFLYILIPILITITGLKNKTLQSKLFFITLTVVICLANLFQKTYFPTLRIVFYAIDFSNFLSLFTYYLIGVLFTFPEIKKLCNLQVSVVFLLIFSSFQFGSFATAEFFRYLILPYFVFSFSFASPPYFVNMFKNCEMSYSIYLYGFVIQQCTIWFFQKHPIITMTYNRYFVISTLLILVIAYLSYRWIELPSIALIKKLSNRVLEKSKS